MRRQVTPSAGAAVPAPQRFAAALDALVDRVRQDRSVLAALLCGSLSHDVVWDRSDIDLVLMTVDDRREQREGLALYADGINVHAILMPRARFRAVVEGSIHNSFVHALLAKGRLLYTHDDTIAALCARLNEIGDRDTALQRFRAATAALPSIDKARKWLVTRGDLEYTALWILHAATALARLEVVGRGLVADREVLPQALGLNPELFRVVYVDLLNTRKTRKTVQAALDAVDAYIGGRLAELFAPLLDHLRDAGEIRSSTEIEDHFRRHFDVGDVTTACEYLASQGVIGKAATPVRLTSTSNVDVQELAFFWLQERPGAR
jgi:predicted nucleotidyltransferase